MPLNRYRGRDSIFETSVNDFNNSCGYLRSDSIRQALKNRVLPVHTKRLIDILAYSDRAGAPDDIREWLTDNYGPIVNELEFIVSFHNQGLINDYSLNILITTYKELIAAREAARENLNNMEREQRNAAPPPAPTPKSKCPC